VHTKSELVFENYCRERGYLSERIEPELNAGQFPDYRVVTPVGPVIVEIKEFTPNKNDRRFVDELRKLGRADAKRSIGKRVRSAIKDAAPQLRRYEQDPFPEVLLLYDNIYDNSVLDDYWPWARNEYLQALDIASGMFGSPRMRFWLDPGKRSVEATDYPHGGGRQLTNTERLYIGAVAILNEATEQTPIQIDFFHNWFSTKPVWPKYFQHPSDRHFIKTGHPDSTGWDWSEFVGDRQKDAFPD
jgi:hypothetical protein